MCPSESQTQRLYGGYAIANYVGNYGGPAPIMPYSGVIIPNVNLEFQYYQRLGSVSLASITDGTSNTGLFSERLVANLGTLPCCPTPGAGSVRSS